MRKFRLCRSTYPAYDGEGARLVGGRWNSKGVRVLYMSENRSLAVSEVLVHLSGELPDKYLLGSADIPEHIPVERIDDEDLHEGWKTIIPGEQGAFAEPEPFRVDLRLISSEEPPLSGKWAYREPV